MLTDFSCFSLFVRKVKPEHVCQDFIWKISEKVAFLLEPTENFMLVKSMNSAEECILTENGSDTVAWELLHHMDTHVLLNGLSMTTATCTVLQLPGMEN